ncbi:alpha-adducin [Bombina bombina]|uniref:alpha-adducin n=1 Tax=Bombina bombina TaxID=8345 RepID=UPI00235AB1F0|nr:alpha-adducin [Bombina bombina]
MNGDSSAGVVTAPPPTNAPHKEKYFDRVDENNPEYLRERNMAPDLRQDFNMMEQKKRVSMILQSPAFCDELETMIQDQLKKGKNPTGLLALQQIADFMTTSVPSVYPSAPQGGMAALNLSLGMVTPVNDLRGSDSIAYEKGEKLLRCKLAAFYRLADLFGWSQLIYNHITVRVNSEQELFLIVPFGLLYSEVTASSLVKINLQGEMIDRGSTNLGVNKAGFTLHSAIYAARPDVKCIVHIHTPAGAAVSAMKCGLLPLSPEALSLGEVAYHDYHGILVSEEEKVLIQKNLGPRSKVLILRNHGLVTMGESVEEAFYYIHNLMSACEIQVRTLASAGGPDNLVFLDPEKYKKSRSPESPAGDGSGSHPKWLVGEQEFEALMRMLDNLGKTWFGPGLNAIIATVTGDIKSPHPTNSPNLLILPGSHHHLSRRTNGPKSSTPIRNLLEGMAAFLEDYPKKGSYRPILKTLNKFVCVPPFEDGNDPYHFASSSGRFNVLYICKHYLIMRLFFILQWTKEDGLRAATSAVPNLFVPMNTDPKEVQEMRNKIREQNLQDIKTAGPQSQVLCGGVVERSVVQKLSVYKDAPLSDCSETIEGLDLSEQTFSPSKLRKGELVTASKAIIEKEYQPQVIVSKAGPNPFNKFTDRELDEYRKEVERKQKNIEDELSRFGETVVPRQTLNGETDKLKIQNKMFQDAPVNYVAVQVQPPVLPREINEDTKVLQEPELLVESMHKLSVIEESNPEDKLGPMQLNFEEPENPDSPHREFHSAVIQALNSNSDCLANISDQSEEHAEQKENILDLALTRTPPSTPVKQEESQQEQTYKDDSDAATLKQTIPDLTPDEPSEALSFQVLGNKDEDNISNDGDLVKVPDSFHEIQDPQTEHVDSPITPVADDVVQADAAQADAGSDESPGKSPSKKKKKFRTPSFLKKNKKKTES